MLSDRTFLQDYNPRIFALRTVSTRSKGIRPRRRSPSSTSPAKAIAAISTRAPSTTSASRKPIRKPDPGDPSGHRLQIHFDHPIIGASFGYKMNFTSLTRTQAKFSARQTDLSFDIQVGKRIDVQTPPLELPFQDGPGFEWFADSKSFNYDYDERGYKAKEFRLVDAATGEQKVLVREQAEPYIDPGETFYRFVNFVGNTLVVRAQWVEPPLRLQPEDGAIGKPDHPGALGSARNLIRG